MFDESLYVLFENSFWPAMFHWVAILLIVYFSISNLINLVLLIVSFFVVRRAMVAHPMIRSIWVRTHDLGPPISIIAPAHNESAGIVEATLSFLSLNYPAHEVIVVNDESRDDTMQKLKEFFGLEKAELFYDNRLSKSTVRGVYRSRFYRNLIVIDKSHGGKADSINVGLGFAQYDLFCSVDCDSVLDDDALVKVALPFIEESETVIASGGTVRPLNGSRVENGRIVQVGISRKPIVLIQVVEYLRAFLFGRIGWNYFDCTLIISGAFGVFNRRLVMDIGGFLDSTVGEDMELVLRLRHTIGREDLSQRIAFIPDPICWTQVPEDWASLARQRRRWQRGLAESLLVHRRMLFNKRFGLTGFFAFPYFIIFELLGPIFELGAYAVVLVGFALGWVQWELVILLFMVDIFFSVLMSMGAVLIEEGAYHKYQRIKYLFVLLLAAFFEPLGFRQFTAYHRLLGLWDFISGSPTTWGAADRQKI